MPQRRPHGFRYQPRIEQLEDRSVPAVLASVDANGLLTVTLNAANDAATVSSASATGTSYTVSDGSTTQPFSNVTGISVVDAGSNAGQSVTLDNGPGTVILLENALRITGIETVTFAPSSFLQADSVSVGGASKINLNGDVTTDGGSGQVYDGPVILGDSTVTLSAGASGGVSFSQSVNGASTGGNALVVNAGGVTSFAGLVGASAALASITTDAAGTTTIGQNILTTGAQAWNDPVTLTATLALTSNGSGNIQFASTLNGSNSGASSLTVNTAGSTIFGGAVGAVSPIGGLTTDSAGSVQIKASITTIGAQVFNDAATVSGSAVVLTSTVGGNIGFNDKLDGENAGETALTITTSTGTTSFVGSVGSTTPLGSITTSAGTGTAVFGAGAASNVTVRTTGFQIYNDPVRLNASTIVFASTSNGAISFKDTLNSANALSATATVNTGGLTNFTGVVGGIVGLNALTTDNAGQSGEQTVIQASITTSNDITFGDAVVFTPASGVTSQTLNSSIGDVWFKSTFGSDSAVPVTIKAAGDLTLDGNGSFTAGGSRVNFQTAATGSGAIHFGSGISIKADVQTWQAGDGVGGITTAALDLVTNSPSFRDSTGNNAPKTFVLRQDGNVTDSSVPAKARFGTALPANYTIISDDGTMTLNTTTDLAGPNTTNLTLSSAQNMSLGVVINAPAGIVRLRSSSAGVTQTGSAAITAAGLGVRSGTAASLTGANSITGTFAALATTSSIQMANGSPYAIGTIGAEPLSLVFPSTTGVGAAGGTVVFSQTGAAALDLTIAAPVSGSTVTANGGAANDKITVNYAFNGSISSGLVFNGNGGTDSLILTDSGGASAHTYTIGSTVVRDSAAAISYTGVETVSVTGGTAADTFNVTPDTTAAITVVGGNPTGTTGDKLALTLTGATNPTLNATKQSDGFSGNATFGNKAAVTFSQVESVAPQTDIQVTATAAPQRIPSNGTSTITVVVKNAGPNDATGAAFDQTFPTGATYSWTAVVAGGATVSSASGSGDIHTTMTLPLNGTVTYTIVVTPTANFLGSLATTATATAGSSAFDSNSANNSATATVIVEPTGLTAVGAGAGAGPQVRVFNTDGSQRFSFYAYAPTFRGGVTVATGDLTGDGIEDIVTGAATSASHVKVFDGATGQELASFYAFPGFSGGVNVAIAGGDIVVGAGMGGGPIFAGYHLAAGQLTRTFSMYAFAPSFRGGVQIAGSSGLITVGAGRGGAPHIKVFDATTRALVSSFLALPPNSRGGVSVAMGKIGTTDTVIVGAGAGSTPNVVMVEATTGRIIGSVLAFDAGFKGGVRVASTTTPSGQTGTVFAAGTGGAPRVRVLGPTGAAALDFYAFDAAFKGGVYVG